MADEDMSDYPTMFDPASLVRKGFCPVHSGLSLLHTHSLYYEQHGTGRQRVVLISGLNTNSFAWEFQVRELAQKYSVLVFDNRGVGYSGYPAGRYTTSGMAQDIVTLLDHIGWKSPREIHVVGTSLGGMIAQGSPLSSRYKYTVDVLKSKELASSIPERIASLTLAVTTPGGRPWQNLPPWEGVKCLTRLLFIAEPEKKAPTVMKMLYTPSWLEASSLIDPGRTNRQVQTETYLRRVVFGPKQQVIGHISQLGAGLTHHVSETRLARIAGTIPKVVILCGDQDHLMDLQHSRDLKAAMPDAEFVQWDNTGHGIHSQRPIEFRDLLMRVFEEAEQDRK
ncbi:AB hydrolase-1 domain-containing protein [Mycena indigotica]|uniref:AB hydrolase-1 domain-containing protein n=1 Tax=Mycena indigotica TaxID=2126181 RepID=A0A8H6WKV8_9AGAR|nr:AB hydrolase-1 domain-containing protein [Mycena indigotica]KAF7316149.1 AB hydrolase-1 domain-containing protein [Mycena indigotica]